MLDRTHRPGQQAELYLLAGQVCGQLSTVCFELGHPTAAEEQARAAHTYGSVIDHPALCAWARMLQVTVMYYTGRPRRAATLAASSLETAPAGIARASLYDKQARALALIGAREEVRAALNAAEDEMQRATDDTYLDEIGGELGFDHASHALQAGSSFVALGDGEQAETEATNALQLFSEVPQIDRWVAGELAARVDLATARVMRGELAGAEEALGPVLMVHPELRTEAVTLRLTNLGHRLGTARYRNAEEATRIGEAIEDFTTRGLPRSSIRTIFNPGG